MKGQVYRSQDIWKARVDCMIECNLEGGCVTGHGHAVIWSQVVPGVDRFLASDMSILSSHFCVIEWDCTHLAHPKPEPLHIFECPAPKGAIMSEIAFYRLDGYMLEITNRCEVCSSMPKNYHNHCKDLWEEVSEHTIHTAVAVSNHVKNFGMYADWTHLASVHIDAII